MSYGAHIKRVRTQTSQGITLEEWIAYVRSDKEMRHIGEPVIKRSSSEWPRRWVRLFRVTRANPTTNQEALAPAMAVATAIANLDGSDVSMASA